MMTRELLAIYAHIITAAFSIGCLFYFFCVNKNMEKELPLHLVSFFVLLGALADLLYLGYR